MFIFVIGKTLDLISQNLKVKCYFLQLTKNANVTLIILRFICRLFSWKSAGTDRLLSKTCSYFLKPAQYSAELFNFSVTFQNLLKPQGLIIWNFPESFMEFKSKHFQELIRN